MQGKWGIQQTFALVQYTPEKCITVKYIRCEYTSTYCENVSDEWVLDFDFQNFGVLSLSFPTVRCIVGFVSFCTNRLRYIGARFLISSPLTFLLHVSASGPRTASTRSQRLRIEVDSCTRRTLSDSRCGAVEGAK